jgi:tetratricopeptide (TPR) repeat protein
MEPVEERRKREDMKRVRNRLPFTVVAGRVQKCCVVICMLMGSAAHAQSVRSLVNGGNSMYKEKKFDDAEVNYRKALEQDKGLVVGHFNLGNSLYKQKKYEESAKEYENALANAQEKNTKAFAYYNIGNAAMQEQKYQDAVKSYIESLRLDPNDQEAKYNLSYALEKLKEQQQQQQTQKDKNNKDKNDKKNQQKQEQPKQDQQQNQQSPEQKKQQQNQASQQERKMSKADAQRILDVLKNNEKEVQKKLRVRQATRANPEKDW